MKSALKVSIFLNLLFTAALLALVGHRAKPRPASFQASSKVWRAEPAAPSAAATAVRPPAFRWTQLESTNYRAYVANLRAAGCPESTVQAIVASDADQAFAYERRQSHSDDLAGGPFSKQAENQFVADMMQANPAPAADAAANSASVAVLNDQPRQQVPAGNSPSIAGTFARAGSTVASQAVPRYPLAFEPSVTADPALNKAQQSIVRQVQQQFRKDIGGGDQDPNDPAYASRWQTAQRNADQMLRGTLGAQAYMSYQLEHYYTNFRAVILQAGGKPVTINPDLLAQ